MTGHVAGLLTHHWQAVSTLHFKHPVAGPLTVLPGPDLTGELTEIDFRVKVSGKITSVTAGIDINDVDGVNRIKVVLLCQCSISIHHTGIKTHTQNGSGFAVFTFLLTLPF